MPKVRPDVIVVSDNAALSFMTRKSGDTCSTAVPVVFCGINNFVPELLDG
jgi:hypothetical protein